MQSAKSQDSRVLEISAMTRALKILARELNVAVVVLSQLSREPDKRKDHTPLMSDLRESGSIEQDADVIMMLYRPAAYPDTQEAMDGDNTSYINVAKHRNGANGIHKSHVGSRAHKICKLRARSGLIILSAFDFRHLTAGDRFCASSQTTRSANALLQ